MAANLAADDLSPYYANLSTDGFTAIYEGSATSEGQTYLVEWGHLVEVLSEENGVIQTSEKVILSFGGAIENSVTNFYEISDQGVLYKGNESSASGFGITSTTTLTVIGESLYIPAELDIPGEIEWNATYKTTTSVFGIPFDDIEEERRRLEFAGYESVTVALGTFTALKVLNYELDSEGESTFSGTNWFAPEIGLIKASYVEEDEGQVITYDFEIVSLDRLYAFYPLAKLLEGAMDLDGTYFQEWLGYFEQLASGYMYHYGLGYLYPVELDEDGAGWVFSYNPNLGYVYLDPALLEVPGADQDPPVGDMTGWIYSTEYEGGWVYVYTTLGGQVYVFEEDEWTPISIG